MADFKQISMDTALERMKAESNYTIIDVRSPEEYEAGHIINAINVPLESIGDKEPEQLKEKEQTIYVYCRSGYRSKIASKILADLGYTHIVEFGGILDYKGEIEVDY